MPYHLTQADLDSITDEELAKGTTRLLPKVEDIPLEHWGWFKGVERNAYFRMAEGLYTGDAPRMALVLNPGFQVSEAIKRFTTAHLRALQPEYQHKIAGLAYALSIIMTIKE